MAMAVDSRQQQPQFATPMGYETMRYAPPQFTNPWVSGPAAPQATSLPPAPAGDYKPQAPNVSAAYSSGQVPAPTLPTGIIPMDPALLDQSGLQLAQDGMGAPRPYGAPYTSSAAPNGGMYAPVSQPQYSAEILQRGSPYSNYDRRSSHPSDFTLPRKQSDKALAMRLTLAAEWLPWPSQTLHRATFMASKSPVGALQTLMGSHLRIHRIPPFHQQATTATTTAAP
jgi:hypothetical protein